MAHVGLNGALNAARAGDEAGFATLWRVFQPALLRYLRVVNGEAAEDVASETWLQVTRDLCRFSGDADAFRVWLFRIARNRGLDAKRRDGRHRERLLHVSPPDAAVADASAEALERFDTKRVLSLIAGLPVHQAEAVMLRVAAGLDVAAAAAVLGKRPGAVRMATLRGLRRLANSVEVRAWRDARVVRPVAKARGCNG